MKIPKSKGSMCIMNAREEAERRWGYQARAEHSAETGFAFIVSSRYRNHYGESHVSFEDAFANAELNEA